MHPELEALLTTVSESLDDDTAKLVCADWCQENGETDLEKLLRHLAADPVRIGPIFTGSRRYGTPRPDSDFDWVLFETPDGIRRLSFLLGQTYVTTDMEGECGIDLSLRFGPVNLLLVTTHRQWAAWYFGTRRLLEESPVTRDRAVEVFKVERAGRGLLENDEISGTAASPWVDSLTFEGG